MATQEEIKTVMHMLEEFRPFHNVDRLDATDRGIASIMLCLSKQDKPITAGEISERVGVSTARIAVLLRKMSARDLVATGSDPSDARKTLVTISERGKATVDKMAAEHSVFVSTIIDRIGFERTKEFIRISKEIGGIFCELTGKKESGHNG